MIIGGNPCLRNPPSDGFAMLLDKMLPQFNCGNNLSGIDCRWFFSDLHARHFFGTLVNGQAIVDPADSRNHGDSLDHLLHIRSENGTAERDLAFLAFHADRMRMRNQPAQRRPHARRNDLVPARTTAPGCLQSGMRRQCQRAVRDGALQSNDEALSVRTIVRD